MIRLIKAVVKEVRWILKALRPVRKNRLKRFHNRAVDLYWTACTWLPALLKAYETPSELESEPLQCKVSGCEHLCLSDHDTCKTHTGPQRIHGWKFLEALRDAGIIRDGDYIQKVIIEASISDVVHVYVQRVGDDRLLGVGILNLIGEAEEYVPPELNY